MYVALCLVSGLRYKWSVKKSIGSSPSSLCSVVAPAGQCSAAALAEKKETQEELNHANTPLIYRRVHTNEPHISFA